MAIIESNAPVAKISTRFFRPARSWENTSAMLTHMLQAQPLPPQNTGYLLTS